VEGVKRYKDFFEAKETYTPAELAFEKARRTAGLFIGPVLFLCFLIFSPFSLSTQANRLVAVLALVLTFWITEAIPIPATALLGPTLMVVLGIGGVREVFAPFADPVIWLFLGSFILAEGMFSHGLNKRFAYSILSIKKIGSNAHRILFGYGAIACFLSMWLSNTATTAMLYPVGMSILVVLAGIMSKVQNREIDIRQLRYGTSLMLIVAYASSIGGTGTPVGSPPNLIAIGQLNKFVNIRIPFFQWMMIALPITCVMFLILYYYLKHALPAEVEEITESRGLIEEEKRKLGKWTRGEKNCLFAFLFTVTLWITPGFLAIIYGTDSPIYSAYQKLLPEGVAALLGAGLLFILPLNWKERQFTISWSTAVNIDWGTLLLFGGGLSLGEFMFKTNLAHVIGNGLINITGVNSWWAITALFALVSKVITETTSNTAAATMVCPLAIASAQAAGVNPVAPAIASALSASMAFMLPISTPPNAIIYGSGWVPITQMIRHGFVLDVISYIVVTGGVLFMCSLLGLH